LERWEDTWELWKQHNGQLAKHTMGQKNLNCVTKLGTYIKNIMKMLLAAI
jgi:hypothetical protein